MSHMKRYSIPKFWKMSKKGKKFAITPRPGPHKKTECIPLLVVIRNILNLGETSKEAKGIIKKGEILVDKKPRKDPKYPVGLMDVIEIPSAKKAYRVVIENQGLTLKEIKPEEANKKLCRIQNKTTVKSGVIQLNLHDGRNILTENNSYKPNDSVLIELPSQKILKHFKFEKGAPATIVSGRNLGTKGKIKEIKDRKTMMETSLVIIETTNGDIETIKDYVFVGEV
ncbi:MAG: 30S ribosomal protein S4e [Candidatus Aenigmarchaeota archaeon]|nr:30S ribosomal protein S4e [Candidatus Aenigmarchaeota archaeon]